MQATGSFIIKLYVPVLNVFVVVLLQYHFLRLNQILTKTFPNILEQIHPGTDYNPRKLHRRKGQGGFPK